jgi:hypothetical protein
VPGIGERPPRAVHHRRREVESVRVESLGEHAQQRSTRTAAHVEHRPAAVAFQARDDDVEANIVGRVEFLIQIARPILRDIAGGFLVVVIDHPLLEVVRHDRPRTYTGITSAINERGL